MNNIFIIWLFLIQILTKDAISVTPLLSILDIADKNLEFWYKDGQFLVGIREKSMVIDPFQNDLVPPNPQAIPEEINTWNSLAKDCDKVLKKQFSFNEITYVILKELNEERTCSRFCRSWLF